MSTSWVDTWRLAYGVRFAPEMGDLAPALRGLERLIETARADAAGAVVTAAVAVCESRAANWERDAHEDPLAPVHLGARGEEARELADEIRALGTPPAGPTGAAVELAEAVCLATDDAASYARVRDVLAAYRAARHAGEAPA